jgi:hypothetical protein
MMRGDFSNWRNERRNNFNGVLHQQGRVLLDADWNAQTVITNDWQDTAGRDIVGAGVAAIPADAPLGFKVVTAAHDKGNKQVKLSVNPGRCWADGLLTHLFGEPVPDSAAPVTRLATYLPPPFQPAADYDASIAAGVRDAVVLELWREETHALQQPDLLIEPALGGPDTTERVRTAMAFRLLRLAAGETCETIGPKLRDDFNAKGHLTASLDPALVTTDDCPVVTGGGYTGFEHNLYRIEIADVGSGVPTSFKWSQYNGGLVGRGRFTAAPDTVAIKANLQPITTSGLTSFYLEALEYDALRGHWRVTYGAPATLNGSVLQLGAKVFGNLPTYAKPEDSTFFRLWNGIEPVSAFTAAKNLPNNVGIKVKLGAPGASNYKPGDYWAFAVRAGEIANPETLIDDKPPEGIRYHRVPLAVLTWKDDTSVNTPVEDCRFIFDPLTRLATCCTVRVGDGTHSHGHFDSIQEAIDSLPASGGEVCILQGLYKENVRIEGRKDITLKGCGPRTRLLSGTDPTAKTSGPLIHIKDSVNIRVESLAVIAHAGGIGVLVEGPEQKAGQELPLTRDVALERLRVEAAFNSAVEAHVCHGFTVRGCDVLMADVATDAPAIFFTGDDALIERNRVRCISPESKGGVADAPDPDTFVGAQTGKGGIQIGGTSERVHVVENLIQGGRGDGITLGTLAEMKNGLLIFVFYPFFIVKAAGDCDCGPTDTSRPPVTIINLGSTLVSAGALYDIRIERNRIYNMGANGVGVVHFFDLAEKDEFITVKGLDIIGNDIRRCMARTVAPIKSSMLGQIGYGGIALADVENLTVRDNRIKDNGPSWLMPICGLFVLHGEGVEVSRNLILNNGARVREPAEKAQDGPRGGIHIAFAVAPHTTASAPGQPPLPLSNGVPALVVHDNVVSTPLGRALALVALGPVSVVANEFTTLAARRRVESFFDIAATVFILNLGLSNEFYFQFLSFKTVAEEQTKMPKSNTFDGDTFVSPQPGLDDERLGQYLAGGNVLFADNQCMLNLIDTVKDFAIASIVIASLDDVGFHDNQCDCDLPLGDLLISHSIMFGISLRVSDNRFKESLLGAWLSAITLGIINTTTDNQGTHCFWIMGSDKGVVATPNTVLSSLIVPRLCAPFDRREKVEQDETGTQPGVNRGFVSNSRLSFSEGS